MFAFHLDNLVPIVDHKLFSKFKTLVVSRKHNYSRNETCEYIFITTLKTTQTGYIQTGCISYLKKTFKQLNQSSY